MSELGISVYPDLRPLSEIREYFSLASQYGCTRVFSSMFSVEGTNEEIIAYFRDLISAAHEYNLKVSLDVNPGFLKKLGVTPDNLSLFADIGCDILRMDLSYGKETDLLLCQNPYGIVIQLNASMGIEEELKYLKENGVDSSRLLLGHNFYPQRYTGLKWKSFVETNEKLKVYDYPIDAFIASHNENTHGVWDAKDGLPTVEKMRDYPADLAWRVMEILGVDCIMFGNAYAAEEEFRRIEEVRKAPRPLESSPMYKMFSAFHSMFADSRQAVLRVKPAEGISETERYLLFEMHPQMDFGDSSEWIWRSRTGRFGNESRIVEPRKEECAFFEKGDVVMVNDSYKHYSGEVQIVRIPIVNDGSRNLVGRLAEYETDLLDLIQDGDIVTFIAA